MKSVLVVLSSSSTHRTSHLTSHHTSPIAARFILFFSRSTMMLFRPCCVLLWSIICPISCHALSSNTSKQRRTYNYFAFGSNMCSATMIDLRKTSPIASSAAILPGHELRFNIPGILGIEPSSASVEPVDAKLLDSSNQVVHGTLYKLSEDDFTTIW